MKRKLVVLSSFFVGISICVLIFIYIHRGAKLTVVNDSKKALSGVSVELVGYGTKSIGTIPPGGKADVVFRGYSDSCWILTVNDYDDKSLRKHSGYVTHGLNFDDRIILGDSGVVDFNSISWSFIPPIRTLFSW